ncbi:hypothetical protein ONZ45_g14401 [Pleurotus djamor]|nr:hypothetical protein ONZ45_g14401 [Pleurotus djamor]
MFGTLIFGMLIVQMFWYHVNFPKDSVYTRIVAWFSFLLSAAFTALSAASAWSQFGVHWGDLLRGFFLIDRSWAGFPPISGIIGSTTQLFFAWRTYQLIGNPWLLGIISLLSFLQCTMTIYLDARVLAAGFTYLALLDAKVYLDLWLCSSLACDLMITGSMLIILMRARSGSSFKPTLTTMNKIIKFTVETGLVTSIWAIIQLILWLKSPLTGYHLFFFMNRGRLYSTWLLSTLNSRSYLNQKRDLSDTKHSPFEHPKPTITIETTTEIAHTDGHEMAMTSSKSS